MNSVLSLDSGSCVKRVTDSRVQTLSKTIKGLAIKRPTKPTRWWPRMAPSPCLTNLTTGIVCVVMDEFKTISGLVCVRVEVHCRNSKVVVVGRWTDISRARLPFVTKQTTSVAV
jgi:hypothetical protein